MEPLRLKMSNQELEKRMKELEKEDQEKLDKEKEENDKFLDDIRNKIVK